MMDAAHPPSEFQIEAIRLVCQDVEVAIGFYERAFSGVRCETGRTETALEIGAQRIEFVGATNNLEREDPPLSNSTAFQHLAIVVSDMSAAMIALRRLDGWTEISRNGPERLPEAAGGVRAFKFADPEGHPLEFLTFPQGRTPPYWQALLAQSPHNPFLGIDHSAITVADTGQSIAFYERLGFSVASSQTNQGPEQARLDAIEDPTNIVTALMPPGGAPPHIELLCYRQPGILKRPVGDGDPLATMLVLAPGGKPTSTLRDPDGHRLLLPLG